MNNNIKYWYLLAIETIGASIIVIKGFPLYKILYLNFDQFKADGTYAFWGVIAIVLMQIPHWHLNIKLSTPNVCKSLFMCRFVSFIGRLYFIIPGALFSFIFLRRFDEMNLSAYQIIIMIVVLFSMYCYTRDLEELAKSFKKC